MKEQLKQMSAEVRELAELAKRFAKKKEIFNFEVKEALEEMEIEEFCSEELKDSYSRACALYLLDGDLIQIVEELKAEHPKYGENRIRTLAKKEYMSKFEAPSEEYVAYVDNVLDLYFLYESFGFSKIRSLEVKRDEMSSSIVDGAKEQAASMVDGVKEQADYVVKNRDVIWEETKGKASAALTKTRRRIGQFLLDMDKDK